MRYPNLRYGNPSEFAYHVQGLHPAIVAKMLRLSERSVRNWLSGRAKLPWWVPEIMRLMRLEADLRQQQMNMGPVRARLGLVGAELITFPAQIPPEAPKQPESPAEPICDTFTPLLQGSNR